MLCCDLCRLVLTYLYCSGKAFFLQEVSLKAAVAWKISGKLKVLPIWRRRHHTIFLWNKYTKIVAILTLNIIGGPGACLGVIYKPFGSFFGYFWLPPPMWIIVDFLLTPMLTMWISPPPLVLKFLKNILFLKKITGRTVKWDAENTVICREMKYFKKFLLKSK